MSYNFNLKINILKNGIDLSVWKTGQDKLLYRVFNFLDALPWRA
jgi:hypothetical protein